MREAASRGFWVSSLRPLRLQPQVHGPGRSQRSAPPWRLNPDTSDGIVKPHLPDLAEARDQGHPGNHQASSTTRASPVPRGKPSGARPASTASSPTRLTPAPWYGVTRAKDKVRAGAGGEGLSRRRLTRCPVSSGSNQPSLRSKAPPKFNHPRRVGSSYLLSGLDQVPGLWQNVPHRPLRQERPVRLLRLPFDQHQGQAQHACETPTAQRQAVSKSWWSTGNIRSNILTERQHPRPGEGGGRRRLGGVTREQREKRLETIDDGAGRRCASGWAGSGNLVETTDMEVDDIQAPHPGT